MNRGDPGKFGESEMGGYAEPGQRAGYFKLAPLRWSGTVTGSEVAVNKCGELRLRQGTDLGGFDVAAFE